MQNAESLNKEMYHYIFKNNVKEGRSFGKIINEFQQRNH